MFERQAKVNTRNARHYIRRLCKHFGHKVTAVWCDDEGRIDFVIGQCSLRADEVQLFIRCEATDKFHLNEVVETIDGHFERFSYREGCQVHWADEVGVNEAIELSINTELVEV